MFDNPIWSALETEQAAFAVGDDAMRWFPADVAPFCAVGCEGQPVGAAAMRAALAGCAVRYFVGLLPALPSAFKVSGPTTLYQMSCRMLTGSDGEHTAVRDLGALDVDAMLELTALAFPGFFRRRTIEMGRYLGIRHGGALVAMGGERLALPGGRELSAVCTHPAHGGQGLARAIVRRLTARILAEGVRPFLHVHPANAAAIRLYEASGFTTVNAVRLLTVLSDT